ncbi:MAG: bacteriohemerythrin [Polyangiaceae bacterium]
MALMEWSPKLSVGIGQFDNEHKKLLGMLNELYDAAQAGSAKDHLGKILDGLINYTKTHFANEERYMKMHKYPDFEAHRAEHDALAKQVLAVQSKYHAGASAALGMEVLSFLKNWLTKHIQGSDKKYAPFLIEHGVH